MSEREDDRPEPPAAVLKFSGNRFQDAGMPAEALSEIVAFQALLTEVAKAQFRRTHNRVRVPAGFEERLSLRLRRIERGSVMPVLFRPTDEQPLPHSDLFDDPSIPDIFDEAREAINGLIISSHDDAPLPAIFSDVPAPVLKRFGQSLLDDDSLQVGVSNGDGVWDAAPKYTRKARQSLLLKLTGTYTDLAAIDGTVDNLGLGQQSFGIKTDDGRVVPAPYTDEEFRVLIRRAEPVPTARFHVEGEGEFGSDSRLIRFLTVHSLEASDEATAEVEYDRANQALLAVAELEEGWEDGEAGLPVAEEQIRFTRIVLAQMRREGIPAPYVYPSELGGIEMEWSHGIFAISLEIRPDDSRLILQSTNTEDVTYTTIEPEKTVEGLSLAMSWLKQQMGVLA